MKKRMWALVLAGVLVISQCDTVVLADYKNTSSLSGNVSNAEQDQHRCGWRKCDIYS